MNRLTPKITPSMMCADISSIGDTIKIFEAHHIPYLHIDVMDGTFVPNIMLGTSYISQLRKTTNIPLDIHLMIEEPLDKLEWFNLEPNDYVSIHVETTKHLQRTLAKVRSLGAKPMAALNPATPLSSIEEILPDIDAVLLMTVNPGYAGQHLVPQTLDKIKRLRSLLDDSGYYKTEIEVDGNVSFENAVKMRNAGANIFVAGSSSVFAPGSLDANITKLQTSL
jgi:ribulose-phosphate 3-epimerase